MKYFGYMALLMILLLSFCTHQIESVPVKKAESQYDAKRAYYTSVVCHLDGFKAKYQ